MKYTLTISAVLLAFPVLLVSADDQCGGTLLSLCCKTVSGPYPRGYVGSGCSLRTSGDSCDSKSSGTPLCCQQLTEVRYMFCAPTFSRWSCSLRNDIQDGVGYYCRPF
ncbi:hypothetical protein GALMADRAFT_885935 [Galerina marginata CBS 339.88]|uniref:Hydrophobin n=1 Tax=Galerina marginata (strain CBS 339.88) TaxID=685588 RepID=A0A067SHX0_GALM3|nr:hypothetical protein GALMADRAFT_885935 [Galerina marginata CBS 339.88]